MPDSKLKYYIYISDAKVDMLYPQIPKPLLTRIASSLNIDLKLLGAELNVGTKGGRANETRYSKVKIVSEYIEKHLDVGNIEAPSTYFRDKLPMRWAIFEEPQPIVYFGGTSPRTVIGLGGSPEHIIGSKPPISRPPKKHYLPGSAYPTIQAFLEAYRLPGSAYPARQAFLEEQQKEALQKLYYQEQSPSFSQTDKETIIKNIAFGETALMFAKELPEPTQQLEFLAKTILQRSLNNGLFSRTVRDQSRLVLGTPIYVAVAD